MWRTHSARTSYALYLEASQKAKRGAKTIIYINYVRDAMKKEVENSLLNCPTPIRLPFSSEYFKVLMQPTSNAVNVKGFIYFTENCLYFFVLM